jgi:mRNA interferase HicA
MKGKEFIKRVKKIGRDRNIAVRVDKKRGKGSHVTLYFGEQFTVVRNPQDELKTGTLRAMLRQLNITREEFEAR